MSLTSLLADSTSPVARFVEFVGTTASNAKRGALFGRELRQVVALDARPRTEVVPPIEGAGPGIVGTAFHYRVLFHMAPIDVFQLEAASGAKRIGATNPEDARVLGWFLENAKDLLLYLAPAGRRLTDADEVLLARYCVVLALLGGAYHSSWRPDLSGLMLDARASATEEPLLALAPDPVVRDVVSLSRNAERVLSPLIDVVISGKVPFHPHPQFAGSPDVRGAVADFIVGPVIYEVKTTTNPGPDALREALLQLLAYVLLDYGDFYCVRAVGLYFPRQDWVGEMYLWRILMPPADVVRHLAARTEPTEAEVIARLAKLRALMRRVALGEEIDYEAEFS